MAAPRARRACVDRRVLRGLATRQGREQEAGKASAKRKGQSAFRLHGWSGLLLHGFQGWQI